MLMLHTAYAVFLASLQHCFCLNDFFTSSSRWQSAHC